MIDAVANRLPDELFGLLHDDRPASSPLASISNFSEETRQLGLLMYVVSVVLPVLEPVAR